MPHRTATVEQALAYARLTLGNLQTDVRVAAHTTDSRLAAMSRTAALCETSRVLDSVVVPLPDPAVRDETVSWMSGLRDRMDRGRLRGPSRRERRDEVSVVLREVWEVCQRHLLDHRDEQVRSMADDIELQIRRLEQAVFPSQFHRRTE